MKRMVIDVTAEDYAACDKDCVFTHDRCLVATAMRRITGKPWNVGVLTANVNNNYYWLPAVAVEGIKGYLDKHPFVPFSFELAVRDGDC